jgi:hypothetical protein
MGRPRLPEGQAREVVLRTRVRPDSAARLDTLRGSRTRSEVVREAVGEWLARRAPR